MIAKALAVGAVTAIVTIWLTEWLGMQPKPLEDPLAIPHKPKTDNSHLQIMSTEL